MDATSPVAAHAPMLSYAPPAARAPIPRWLQLGSHGFAATLSAGMTSEFVALYQRFGRPGFLAALLLLVVAFAVVGVAFKALSVRWLGMGAVMFVIGWVDYFAWGSGWHNPSPDFAMLGGVVLMSAGVIRWRFEWRSQRGGH